MLPVNKIIKSILSRALLTVSLFAFSIPLLAEDSTIYVKLNTNPFSSPFYIFSNEPNGESTTVSLEKGSTYTFIRTDSGHAFNIGNSWREANTQIQASSTGSGGMVGEVASIVANEQLTITIPLNFTGDQLSYFCYPHSVMIASFDVVERQQASWDFDGSGDVDALTDGLLLLRYTFGLRGNNLTSGAMATNSSRSSLQIEDYISSGVSIADIDSNGQVDALTDGLLLLRYLFGLRGSNLVLGAVSVDASRTSSDEVEQYIASLMPEQILAQASGLLVPMKSSQEFTSKLTQSYDSVFGEVASAIALDAVPEMAMDSAVEATGGESFTTTYTLEKTIDEHDFVKYDGDHLFIAPSYSMHDDCCFIINEPVAIFDDAIEVDEESVVADEPIVEIPELRSIKIMSTDSDQATAVQVGNIIVDENNTIEGLYTNDTQLAAINSSGWWGMYGDVFMSPTTWRGQTTGLDVYDISNTSDPEKIWDFEIEAGFVTSRKKGDIVYLVARHTPQITNYVDNPSAEQKAGNQEAIDETAVNDLLPKAYINGEQTDLLAATDCLMINEEHDLAPNQYGYPTMTLLVAIDVTEKTVVNSSCYLESTSGVYVSQNAIYFIQSEGWGLDSRTLIHRFNLSANLGYSGSGQVNGHLFGSGEIDFRINEHDGFLRVVSSQWTGDSNDNRDHQLTVLKLSPSDYSLTEVATLPNEQYPNEIGKPNEDLYGVRFFGDTLYLVTFERTDPLYVLDLSDQENPIIAGELEVTGFSDFLHPVNDELLLGLGQDEDGLIKLELFNVESMDNPVSLSSLSVGQGSSWIHSPARYNRHAFTYQQINETQDRFSVPVTLSQTSSMSYSQENRLYMFNLTNKNDPESASIVSNGYLSGGTNDWWSNNDRQRAFFHDNSVFYINGENVISAFWEFPQD
ncbi:MAG: beta-propeller domain-containing protein [Porticoccaceae bacterium]|nr:beta-propeller domain-containing protein [Porticoccaceae bacterium]